MSYSKYKTEYQDKSVVLSNFIEFVLKELNKMNLDDAIRFCKKTTFLTKIYEAYFDQCISEKSFSNLTYLTEKYFSDAVKSFMRLDEEGEKVNYKA